MTSEQNGKSWTSHLDITFVRKTHPTNGRLVVLYIFDSHETRLSLFNLSSCVSSLTRAPDLIKSKHLTNPVACTAGSVTPCRLFGYLWSTTAVTNSILVSCGRACSSCLLCIDLTLHGRLIFITDGIEPRWMLTKDCLSLLDPLSHHMHIGIFENNFTFTASLTSIHSIFEKPWSPLDFEIWYCFC